MRFYKVVNNNTKEVFLTAQIDDSTLCGMAYNDGPLSSIEKLLELTDGNFTALDNLALSLLNPTNLKINLEDLISSSKEKSGLFRMCQPYTPTEIWAAGVTYKSSELERKRESETPDVYAKVYNSERPEIFFKATKERSVGPFDEIGIRQDSHWNVPEAELALVLYQNEIVGYTIGNDMSSRSIEGENPLYLPQAKVYNKSFSIGPCIISSEGIDPQNLKVGLKIFRNGEVVFDGNSSTKEMKRNVAELVDWLQRSNDLPEVAVLMTGTGIIPPQEFTLKQDDTVEISIEKIGTLRNKISLV